MAIAWGSILLAVIVCGVLALLVKYLPIDDLFKKIAVLVILLALILYVINALGLVDMLNGLGHHRRG
jgi:hypothetical protein